MRKRLTIGVIATALAATVSLVAAGPYYRQERTAALAPDEIVAAVQSYGLVPTTRVFRRGPFYVLHALDRRGTELRVVADAALGDIISITPLYVPRAFSGPRIIHVPQPDDAKRDEAAVPDEPYAEPPARRRAHTPRASVRRKVTPAHSRRNTSSAPPAPPSRDGKSRDEKLNPVYPTPQYKSEIAPKATPKPAPHTPPESATASKAGNEGDADNRRDADIDASAPLADEDAKRGADEGDKLGADEGGEKFGAPAARADRTRLPPPENLTPPARD